MKKRREGARRPYLLLLLELDSCHSRVIRNQQYLFPKFPPTAVVKLLQHSGLGSNSGMGFLHAND